MKNVFRFTSTEFNCTQVRSHYINDCCFGDDFIHWISEELGKRGALIRTIEQEDWGWYTALRFATEEYVISITFQPNDVQNGDCWIGWVEKNESLWERFRFWKKEREVPPRLLSTVDDILRCNSHIESISWSDTA